MTSVTMAKVRAPKAKKNRTAGDWFILALLIVGGLVMLFPHRPAAQRIQNNRRLQCGRPIVVAKGVQP